MNYFLFIATVLSVSGICNIRGILSPQMMKLLFLLLGMACLFCAKYNGRSLSGIKYPRNAYLVLLAAMCVAVACGFIFHSQTMLQSAISASDIILAYILFWAWLKMDIPYEKVMKFLIILGLAGIPVYMLNAMSFPNFIFGDVNAFGEYGEDFSRGILRLPVYYIELYAMLVLYSVNQWMVSRKKKWVLLFALFTMMVILSVMRKMIFITAVLVLVMYLRNASWTRRILASSVVALVIFVVLPSIPFYQTMVQLSEQQVLENSQEDDIRIVAARSYGNDFQTNDITRVFGNGVPSIGSSAWGAEFESFTEASKCYPFDVGWFGFYWYFGLIAVVALFIILSRSVIKSETYDRQYLSYWFVLIILTSIVAGPILYPYQIVSITIGLYLVYGTSSAPETEVVAETTTSIGPLARLRNSSSSKK